MKRFTLLLVLFLSLLSNVVYSQLYSFKNYNYKEGLSYSNIQDIVQTDDGNIWLASEEGGLIKFNGKTFQEIQYNNLNLNNIVSISKAKDNSLFFASKNKGIYKIGNGKTNLVYQNKRQSSNYSGVFSLNNGMVFVFNKTILIYKGDKIVSQKRLSSKFDEIKPFEFIPIKNGGILLTNIGGFYISEKTNEISFLSNYTNELENKVFKTGYFKQSKIHLFTENLEEYCEILINENGNFENKSSFKSQSPLWNNDKVTASTYIAATDKYYLVSKNGIIYTFKNVKFHEIQSNTNEKPVSCSKVI